MKTYLFSYPYKGGRYVFEITADSLDEARERLGRVPYARYDGELVVRIPAVLGPLAGLGMLLAKIRNWWRSK